MCPRIEELTSERLGSGLQASGNHAGAHTLVRSKVLEEQVQITVEAGDGAGRNEGVNSSVAIGA